MYIGEEKGGLPANRYWDNSRNAFITKILPGEYYYTTENEYIATTLGSCISACIWDEDHKVGGMNHFMLPMTAQEQSSVTWGNAPTEASRYGNYAMEYLINEILKHGGEKSHFKVKLFGGGKIIAGNNTIGDKNIKFVLDYIKTEKLNLVSQDLGDDYPRKVLFDPLTGRAWIKKLKDSKDNIVAVQEKTYQKTLEKESTSGGEVDLF